MFTKIVIYVKNRLKKKKVGLDTFLIILEQMTISRTQIANPVINSYIQT